jgi:creatinine amidohydrolase
VIFADNTRRRWAETLGDEFKSGDCHAGRYESSLVLHADPAAVREGERGKLEPVAIDLIAKMKAGVTTFREMGADRAYCGDPAAASADEGRDLADRLARMVVAAALEAWPELGA